jgi:chitodextrinase
VTQATAYHRRPVLRRAPVLAGVVAVLVLSLSLVGLTPAGPDGLRAGLCGTWVLQESSTVADLRAVRPQIESALSLPGVAGFSLRFRWKAVDTDFAVLEEGLAIARASGKAFTIRFMAGKHTPARVFDAGSPFYTLPTGEKVPSPFYPNGSPNLVFEQAYDEYVGRLAAWSRANGVQILHLAWYGQNWAELNHGTEVRSVPGYSLDAWLGAHRRLIDIAVRHSGPDLSVELPLSGYGPLSNGPSAALADHVVATAGAGSEQFFVQANGWGPNGDWGTTSPGIEAQFDQIWSKPLNRGEQAVQAGDYDWTLLYGFLYANQATYTEVYLASFSLTRKDLLAAEIARFAETCRPPPPSDTRPPDVPSDLAATAGEAEVTVTFQAVVADDLAGYDVRRKESAWLTWAAAPEISSTAVTFTDLTNGTSYDFSVRSRDIVGNASEWSEPVSATPAADPAAPTVTITSPADGARVLGPLGVAIEPAEGSPPVSRVDLLVDGSPAGSADTVPVTITWDSTSVADGDHTLRVRATGEGGVVGTSAPVRVSVDNTAPAVPGGVAATAGQGEATVSFAAVSAGDLDRYQARMKPSPSPSWDEPVDSTSSSVTFSGLDAGQSYDFSVRSLDTLGNASAWSEPESATPFGPDEQAPAVFVTTPAGGVRVAGTAGVSADASDDRGPVARVELLVDGLSIGSAAAPTATALWDTTLAPDGSHVLTATAVDQAGNVGHSAPVAVTVDNTAPASPAGLTAVPGDRQVGVSFNAVAVADLAGYDLRMKPSLSSTWATPVATTSTSHTFTGLTNGARYDFSVRSRDTLGNASAWSAAVSATPVGPDRVAPTTPTGLTAPQRNRNSIQICWNASTDNVAVTGYRVSRNGTTVATTTQTCYLVGNLQRNTNYTLSVRAFDAAGNLSGTASITARTRS